MKKLLSLLGAIGLVATSSATVVSCGDPDSDTTTYELGDITINTVKGTDDNADKDMAVISDILAAVQTAAEGNKEYQAAYEAAAKDHTIDPEKMTKFNGIRRCWSNWQRNYWCFKINRYHYINLWSN
jgi:hypothetical protein